MAIAPIDLQTLFTQVDKVGKTESSMREGQALHQAIRGARLQQEAHHQLQQVNEAKDSDETDKVKDKNPGEGQEGQSGGKKNKNQAEDPESENQFSILREPNLGSKIDISL